MFAHEEKERSKNQINQYDKKYGNDDGSRRRAPHLFRARTRHQPFVTPHGSDGNPEHDALDQTGHNVAQKKSVQ
jgi:hypothetical protein